MVRAVSVAHGVCTEHSVVEVIAGLEVGGGELWAWCGGGVRGLVYGVWWCGGGVWSVSCEVSGGVEVV